MEPEITRAGGGRRRSPWIALALFSAAALASAEPPASFSPEELLTAAYYIQEGITPLEQEAQRLTGKPTDEQIKAAVDGFEGACNTLAAYWERKGVPLSPEPARAQVREAGWIEQARAGLERQDPAAAREAADKAYAAVLGLAYAALADRYSAVAQQGGADWAFNGWIELAGVRLKQREFVAAKTALWKAYASTTGLGEEIMDPVRKAFETLVERIGKSLMSQGDYPTARDHYTQELAAPELQKTEVVHAGLGLACFELNDPTCAAEQLAKAAEFGTGRTAREVQSRVQGLLKQGVEQPSSYTKASQLVEIWRRIAPQDDEILKVLAAAAQHDPEGLRAWFQVTADCGVKAHLVEALQQGSTSEPYLEAAQAALACDGQNATAQSAVATAYYRLAVRAWNGLAQSRPKDLAAAAPDIAKVRELLAKAEGAERAPELRRKLDDYEGALQENRRKEAELRELELRRQCASLHDRARWAHEQSRVALSDLSDIVDRMKEKGATCATRLEASARKEFDNWQAALADKLLHECDAEYYRLPDLPPDPAALGQDQLEMLRSQIQTFHQACKPFMATSPFRAEKVQALLKGLDVTEAKP